MTERRHLKIPIFYMEEHLSKEQQRLEAEAVNANNFMQNDYERSRAKFEQAGK